MEQTPLANQAERSWGKSACVDAPVADHDESLLVAVLDVEVWRRMVPPVHVDDQPIEGREPRHRSIIAELMRGEPSSQVPTDRTDP